MIGDKAPSKEGCGCERCIGECPTCMMVGGLCSGCQAHFDALAEAAEGEIE